MIINENYKIESDSLNVILYSKGVSKRTGRLYWRPIGYYSNFHSALNNLLDIEVLKTGLEDFEAVCRKQDELYELVNEIKVSSEIVQAVTEPLAS